MRHGRCIYIVGDVHGWFDGLNQWIDREIRQNKILKTMVPRWRAAGDDLQVMILQCGDFAWFWPRRHNPVIYNKVSFLGGAVPIYWTGGNHEDWDTLDRLERMGCLPNEVDEAVFYCPFGSTLKLSPEITALFAGGAESCDVTLRLYHMTHGAPKIWWEQEGISEKDLDRLDKVPKADWVISHTAPEIFDDVETQMRKIANYRHFEEPSPILLDRVFERYRPKKWFFGHFHHYMQGETKGCSWEGLANLDGAEKAWTRLFLEWED